MEQGGESDALSTAVVLSMVGTQGFAAILSGSLSCCVEGQISRLGFRGMGSGL